MTGFWSDRASTRLVSSMRVLAVAVCWSRFGAGMVPAFQDRPRDLVLCFAFWVLSPLAFVGLASRVTTFGTGLVCLLAYYSQGVVGGVSAMSSHHVYAQALLTMLLGLTPCGGSFSVDRWRTGAPEIGPTWGQWILRVQLTVIYLGAVYEKSYLGWLDGSRMAQLGQWIYVGSDDPGPLFDLGAMALAVGTWAIELILAVGIWVRRAKVPVVLLGFVFHGLVYIGTPVATFSTTMFVFLLAALEADRVHGLFRVPAAPRTQRVGLVLLLVPLVVLPWLARLGVPLPVPVLEAFEAGDLTTSVDRRRQSAR